MITLDDHGVPQVEILAEEFRVSLPGENAPDSGDELRPAPPFVFAQNFLELPTLVLLLRCPDGCHDDRKMPLQLVRGAGEVALGVACEAAILPRPGLELCLLVSRSSGAFLLGDLREDVVGRPYFRSARIEHFLDRECFLRQLPGLRQPLGLGQQQIGEVV